MHDFYKVFSVSKTANAEYRDKVDKWEEQYGEKYKRRKKAYPNGYGIIKGKMQTDKQNRFQKAETEGQDDMPL